MLADEGWKPPWIARVLFLGEGVIRDYLEAYKEEERLSFNPKGSEPLLTKEESETLSADLESQVYVKVKDIQAYVGEIFQKTLAIPTLHLWLKKNNFSYKKPKLIPKGAEVEDQKAWIAGYEVLMNQAALDGDPVLGTLFLPLNRQGHHMAGLRRARINRLKRRALESA